MTSLDSTSQTSDSRPSTPPTTSKSSSKIRSQVKHEAVSSNDFIQIKDIKTDLRNIFKYFSFIDYTIFTYVLALQFGHYVIMKTEFN